jgi:hypothetical protein
MARKSAGKTTESGRGRGGRRAEKPSRGEVAVAEREERPEMGEASTATLTHDQIANRAQAIWERRGRPQGQDDNIWHAAEDELKREMGR